MILDRPWAPGQILFRARERGATTVRYVMKQKLFSWGDDFYIKDESQRDIFFVDGKAFSFGDQLSFQDLEGHELAFIKQKLLAWGPTYEIHRDGQVAAVVKKELFTFFNCKFNVDVPGPDDLQASGDFTDHEYHFSRGDRVVATVSKKWFSWTDTYGVDVACGEDDLLILASTIVVDMACHPDDKRD
ncbi:MAG: LURP-one-related family protein [Gemmatimonadota bacterium]|nr:LURP-one-related family protein [Gemmatimonadota bacterium]